jgi:hypothetical protein
LEYIYPYASTKDIQATEDESSPQKRKTLQNMKFLTFFSLKVIIAFLDPDPAKKTNADLNLQHWLKVS